MVPWTPGLPVAASASASANPFDTSAPVRPSGITPSSPPGSVPSSQRRRLVRHLAGVAHPGKQTTEYVYRTNDHMVCILSSRYTNDTLDRVTCQEGVAPFLNQQVYDSAGASVSMCGSHSADPLADR